MSVSVKPSCYVNFNIPDVAIGFYQDIVPEDYQPMVHFEQLQECAEKVAALESLLKATEARLDKSDELLQEYFAERNDAYETLREIAEYAHERSRGPAIEDALWEVRRMAYEML